MLCFPSILGDWNTPEAHSIQYHFGKQSAYSKFTVSHSDSTVWRLSVVIRVSPPPTARATRVHPPTSAASLKRCVFCLQKTWEERREEREGPETFLHEGVWEGAEERSDHLQWSGRRAGGRVQLLGQPHVSQRCCECCSLTAVDGMMHVQTEMCVIKHRIASRYKATCFFSLTFTARLWPEKHSTAGVRRTERAHGHEHHLQREEGDQMDRSPDQLGPGVPKSRGRRRHRRLFPRRTSCPSAFYSLWSLSCVQVERQRRLERIKQKQSQLQELILQVGLMSSLVAQFSFW